MSGGDRRLRAAKPANYNRNMVGLGSSVVLKGLVEEEEDWTDNDEDSVMSTGDSVDGAKRPRKNEKYDKANKKKKAKKLTKEDKALKVGKAMSARSGLNREILFGGKGENLLAKSGVEHGFDVGSVVGPTVGSVRCQLKANDDAENMGSVIGPHTGEHSATGS